MLDKSYAQLYNEAKAIERILDNVGIATHTDTNNSLIPLPKRVELLKDRLVKLVYRNMDILDQLVQEHIE